MKDCPNNSSKMMQLLSNSFSYLRVFQEDADFIENLAIQAPAKRNQTYGI